MPRQDTKVEVSECKNKEEAEGCRYESKGYRGELEGTSVTNPRMEVFSGQKTKVEVSECNSNFAREPKSVAMKAKDTDGCLGERVTQIQGWRVLHSKTQSSRF